MRRIRPAEAQLILPFRIQLAKLLLQDLDLTTHEKHLLRIFAMAIGDKPKREVFMSLSTLKAAMSTSTRTVQRATAGLEGKELIRLVHRGRNGRNCNTWQLRISNLWERAGVVLIEEVTRQPGVLPDEVTRQPGVLPDEVTRQLGVLPNEVARQRGLSPGEVTRQPGAQNDGNCGTNVSPMNHGDGFLSEPARRWTERALTGRDLLDPETIHGLWRHAIDQGQWGASERDELEFYTLCVHCARNAAAPGKLLTAVVFEGKSAKPRLSEEDEARRLLRMRRRDVTSPVKDFAALTAGSFGIPQNARGADLWDRFRRLLEREQIAVIRESLSGEEYDMWRRDHALSEAQRAKVALTFGRRHPAVSPFDRGAP
jgi:hypothetical protein